jgi:hypothetical protein
MVGKYLLADRLTQPQHSKADARGKCGPPKPRRLSNPTVSQSPNLSIS